MAQLKNQNTHKMAPRAEKENGAILAENGAILAGT